MKLRPPRSTRTDTRVPYTTLCRSPGGPSRWNPDKSGDYIPLKHALVAEVIYDQVSPDRFRHGTKLLRWRPDKRSEEHTSELQSLTRISYAVFCLKKNITI